MPAAPESGVGVFIRQSTGLVRSMGTWETLVYNIMITTLILGASLTYLWAPYAFPNAKLWLGVLLTVVLGTPMMVAYAILASAMPRSGGDYVFQSRLLHPALSVGLILSGYVIWLAFWESLGGWMLAVMVVSPFSFGLGVSTGWSWLKVLGEWSATPAGIAVISVVGIVIATIILIRGIRVYLRWQTWLWGFLLLAFFTTWVVLAGYTPERFAAAMNQFVVASGGAANFYETIIRTARDAGFNPTGRFSLLDTLGIAPIAWTALGWCMWSVVSGGELKHARRVKALVGSIVGALVLAGLLIAGTAIVLERALGHDFLSSLGYLYFSAPDLLDSLPVPPFFGILTAIASGFNPLVTILLFAGFAASALQILIGMAWGTSRIMLALAFDRILPEWLGDVNPRYQTPAKSLVVFAIMSLVWVFVYNFTTVKNYTLSVTLASILVYIGTMISAMLLPYRAPQVYQASPAAGWRILGVPLVTLTGFMGLVFNLLLVWFYLTTDALGVNDPLSLVIVFGLFAASIVYYYIRRAWLRRRGFDIDMVFSLIPPD